MLENDFDSLYPKFTINCHDMINLFTGTKDLLQTSSIPRRALKLVLFNIIGYAEFL